MITKLFVLFYFLFVMFALHLCCNYITNNLNSDAMKTRYLFPHSFRKIGWFLFVPSLLASLWHLYKTFYTLATIKYVGLWSVAMAVLVGSLTLIAFSKEKVEDEYIGKVRGDSLVWSLLISYSLTFCAILFLYSANYLIFATINIYLILALFIIKFRWTLHKSHKLSKNEEQA